MTAHNDYPPNADPHAASYPITWIRYHDMLMEIDRLRAELDRPRPETNMTARDAYPEGEYHYREMCDEIDRLRAENKQWRDQYRDIDDLMVDIDLMRRQTRRGPSR